MERNLLNVTSAANVLLKQEIYRHIKEHTVERSLLNVTSAANVLLKQEIY